MFRSIQYVTVLVDTRLCECYPLLNSFVQSGGIFLLDSRGVARIHPRKHQRWKALQQALPFKSLWGSCVCHMTLTTQKMNFSIQDLM